MTRNLAVEFRIAANTLRRLTGNSDPRKAARAQEILEEIRVYLDKDPKGIVDLIGDEVTDAYLRADRPEHRPGGVPRTAGAGLPDQPEGVVEP